LKVEKDMFLDNMGVKTEAALSIANKMYVKKGFPIEPPFSSALEKYFGASAQSVDFLDKAALRASSTSGSRSRPMAKSRTLSNLVYAESFL
jgi:serine protease inhibitor